MSLTPLTPSAARYPYTRPVLSNAGRSLPQSAIMQHPVRFGGLGETVSSLISLIDRNRAIELASSDGLGMLVPRTAVAAGFRGKDDARETLIREGAGLFCVAMLAGLSNQLMSHVLGNRLGFYNPHGTPAKAWISARNLRVYSELYAQSLKMASTPTGARSAFVQRVLDGLESGDKKLSINGRIAALNTLSAKAADGDAAKRALRQMVKDLHGETVSESRQDKYLQLFQAKDQEGLRQEFLRNGWGKLSNQGKEALRQAFNQTAPIDRMAWERIEELEKGELKKNEFQKYELENGASTAMRQRAFLQERLKVSLKLLKTETPDFAKKVDQVALDHGLTSVVHLNEVGVDTPKSLSSGQSRYTMLKEVKAFLEHYVDRATSDVEQALRQKGAQAFPWNKQKELLHSRLFAPSAKGLGRLFPHLEDGLVTASLKAKTAYTVVPIAVAIIANGITTFMNNYITQKKYQGRVFFPGEETYISQRQGGTQTVGTVQTGRWA